MLMDRPSNFMRRHGNQRKFIDMIERDVGILTLALHLLKAARVADMDVIHCNKLLNRFPLGSMMLGLVHVMDAMGNSVQTTNISL